MGFENQVPRSVSFKLCRPRCLHTPAETFRTSITPKPQKQKRTSLYILMLVKAEARKLEHRHHDALKAGLRESGR